MTESRTRMYPRRKRILFVSFLVLSTVCCTLLWMIHLSPDSFPFTGLTPIVISATQSLSTKTAAAIDTPLTKEYDRYNNSPLSTTSSTITFLNTNCESVDIRRLKQRTQVTDHKPHIEASCSLLRAGDKHEAKTVKSRREKWSSSITDKQFLTGLHRNCTATKKEFDKTFYTSSKEQTFPIAFQMLIYYKNYTVQQYIRLLRFLYRPQNAYCIHIDQKSPKWWKNQLEDFVSCFPNILIAKDSVDIKYATATILYAHLRCLKDLLHSGWKWNYVITLHATELPLVTNREMVDKLIKLDGLNFINKGTLANSTSEQVDSWMKYKVKSVYNGQWVVLSKELLDKAPHDITMYKSGSSANSALSREFVKFLFKSQKVKDLLVWLKDVHSAVEFFFSTVNQMPDAPGHSDIAESIEHREWAYAIIKDRKLCGDLFVVHNICIVSAADLPRLTELSTKRKYWFFNKYFIKYDHVVMDCMEELLLQRNIKEFESDCEKT